MSAITLSYFIALKGSLKKARTPHTHTRGDALTSYCLQYHIWAPYHSGFRRKIMVTITR